jgi:hypothetical protein
VSHKARKISAELRHQEKEPWPGSDIVLNLPANFYENHPFLWRSFQLKTARLMAYKTSGGISLQIGDDDTQPIPLALLDGGGISLQIGDDDTSAVIAGLLYHGGTSLQIGDDDTLARCTEPEK